MRRLRAPPGAFVVSEGKQGKRFFFGKKNQKNFCSLGCALQNHHDSSDKSLLLLFFRKEDLACLNYSRSGVAGAPPGRLSSRASTAGTLGSTS